MDNININRDGVSIAVENPLNLPPSETLVPQKTPQQKCEEKGGKWDGDKCIMPQSTNIPKTPQEINAEKVPDFEGPKKFFIGSEELTEEEYIRRKSIMAGTSKGSEGLQVTPEDRAAVERFEMSPEQKAIEQEKQRLIAEETPERRELDPSTGFLETIPIFGGSIALGRTLIGEPLKKKLGIESIQDLQLTPEIMRTEALSRIEAEEINRGLTNNEKFGAIVEGIPLLGTLANNFAGGLIETPSENAKEVKSNILKEKRRISNIETNVKMGYLPVSVAQEQITDIENNVQRLESRIRLLVSNSPELRFNSDYVNTVETEILSTREKAFQAKQNILTGATQDPTEIQILQQLQLQENAQ